MTERLIASTDPADQGYEWFQNLGGYYYVEPGSELKPEDLRPIYNRYTGRQESEFELPDGTVIDMYDLGDYGIYSFPEDAFADELYNIKAAFNAAPYGYVASGSAGLWNGRHRGGKFIADMNELKDTISGYDDVKITDENGEIVLYMYHHDGTNILTLREITKKGDTFRYDNEYDMYEEEIIETIFSNPGYSIKPDIANKVYGSISANRKSKRRGGPKKLVSCKSTKPKASAKKTVKKAMPMTKAAPKKSPAKKTPGKKAPAKSKGAKR